MNDKSITMAAAFAPLAHPAPELLPADSVLMLREARRLRGLSQKDVARLSGVGEKTISSFETGERIESMKLHQLRRLLRVYGLTPAQFFTGDLSAIDTGGRGVHQLPPTFYAQLICGTLTDAERAGVNVAPVLTAVYNIRRHGDRA